MKKIIAQVVILLLDLGLLGGLIINLLKLRQTALQQAAVLNNALNNPGQLLTDNPDALLEKIREAGVPLWAWVANWGGLIITVLFVVAWLIWGQKITKLLFGLNLAWLLLWVAYLVVMASLLFSALSNFL
jgi:hypothetical protein